MIDYVFGYRSAIQFHLHLTARLRARAKIPWPLVLLFHLEGDRGSQTTKHFISIQAVTLLSLEIARVVGAWILGVRQSWGVYCLVS